MTNKELAKLLIYHDTVARVVLHLQDLVQQNDAEATRVWKKIYERRVGTSDVPNTLLTSPVFVLESAVAHIIPVVSFLKRYGEEALVEAGFSRDVTAYGVSFSECGQPVSGNAAKLIVILRNALAHFPDYLAGEAGQPNVAFDTGLVRFWTKNNRQQVVFNNQNGWLRFLKDCRVAVYHLAGKLIED